MERKGATKPNFESAWMDIKLQTYQNIGKFLNFSTRLIENQNVAHQTKYYSKIIKILVKNWYAHI